MSPFTRRLFLSAASALPLGAALPVAAPSKPLDHPDAKLLELGSRLKAALVEENATSAECTRLYHELDTAALKHTLDFRPKSSIDRHLGYLLKNGTANQMIFCPRDIQDLRGILESGEKFSGHLPAFSVRRRAKELIRAQDKYHALTHQPHILEAERRSDAALARSNEIVSQIETAQARTIEGLIVKAQAVRWCRTGDLTNDDPHAATDERICDSMLKDLAALGA